MSTWGEIAAKAREATGPAPEIDGLVHAALNGRTVEDWNRCGGYIYRDAEGRLQGTWDLPMLSGSVDAVLALIAEKLPGVQVDIAIRTDGTAVATIDVGARIDDLDLDPWKDGQGATPALALLAAFAIAIEAEGKEGESRERPDRTHA
jgi:hypothetical protein